MVILLLSFLLLFQTASGMTDTKEPKGENQDRIHILTVAMELAGKTCDIKKVQKSLASCKDVKTALKTTKIDMQDTPILSHAVKHGCSLAVLQELQKNGAVVCGIAHPKKAALRFALLNLNYPEKTRETIVKWLIEQDSYVYLPSSINDGIEVFTDSVCPDFANAIMQEMVQLQYSDQDFDRISPTIAKLSSMFAAAGDAKAKR